MNNLYQGKKVLIFGLGLNQGGVGSAKFFAKQGAIVKATDLKNQTDLKTSLDELKEFKNISYTLAEHKYEDIDWADLIIKNPAVKPGNPYITYAIEHSKQVETDMGIFLNYVKPSQIIGITGTKGKSTTASLIYEILNNLTHKNHQISAGVNTIPPQGWTFKNIVLTGNIGKSVLELIPIVQKSISPPLGWQAKLNNTLVVLELSSFQLETFKQHQVSPKWAVITNITPDHLNYHTSMKDYVESKKIIAKYQPKDDFLFIREKDPVVDQSNFLSGFKANIIRFSKNDLPNDFKAKLLGHHNRENMAAALAVGKMFGLSKKSMLNTLSQFKGVPFRIELIKEWNGVKIYNDTAATSPEAGIQAIKSLGAKLNPPGSHLDSRLHEVQTPPGELILICGGMNKGLDYTKYTTIVEQNVKKVFFLEGDSTESILLSLRGPRFGNRRGNLKIYGPYNDLEKLLMDVKKAAEPDDIILFSPAATSFNLFQNEFDRGRKFNKAVEKVFGEEPS